MLDTSFSSGVYTTSTFDKAMDDLDRIMKDEHAGFKPICESFIAKDSGYGYTTKEIVHQTHLGK